MKHLLICAEDSEPQLRGELLRAFPQAALAEIKPLLTEAGFQIPVGRGMPYLPHARQFLPEAVPVSAESIRLWAEIVANAIQSRVPEQHPWVLHVEPHYGARQVHRMGARAWHSLSRANLVARPKVAEVPQFDPTAGRHRCELIRNAVLDQLRRTRRHLLKFLGSELAPFLPDETLVQVLLTSATSGYLSVCPAPGPFELRHVISFFPLGTVEVPSDKAAPSRAFAKLVEAEMRLGRRIEKGETCVDLGAAPGSWTYVAANRGAEVLAVDRAPLRDDLMRNPDVRYVRDNAFTYTPRAPVDWLLCDVIAEPALSGGLLLKWLRHRWCRAFVVTLKMKDTPESLEAMDKFTREAAGLAADMRLTRLCANKKEVCAYGVI